MWIQLSLNVIILALFYTLLGAMFSYVFYWLFDDFDDEWKQKSTRFQLFDVAFEVGLLGLFAFWSTFNIREAPPIFSVDRATDEFTDSYVSGIFFVFAMFLFLEDLSSKIKYLYDKLIGSHLDHILPKKGSILDNTLRLV